MQNIDITISVGGRIRLLRQSEGMITRTLAKKLKVSQQQLSRYERGVNKIDVCLIYRLCILFNVSAEYFFENISNEISYITIDDDQSLFDVDVLYNRF